MTRRSVAIVVTLGLALLLAVAFVRHDHPPAAAPDPAADFAASIELAPLAAAARAPEGTVFGRVVDPLPLVDAVSQRGTARRALSVAEIERRRVEALHAHDRNASAREVEAARLAAERATLELRAASARVAATWGPDAAHLDLDAMADRLAAGHAAVARLDLPAGAADAKIEGSLALSSPSAPERPIPGRVLGNVATADPLLQGRGYLIWLEPDPPPIGTSLVAHVSTAGPATEGVLVPSSAIVWQGGEPSVFVERAGGALERVPIAKALSVREGWVVRSGLAPGQRVVVRGAQLLLSKELLTHDGAD